ncbi:hypothetical protein [Maioricimonas sp. JC845]|uniref:hypothetical protein n=1 Tax=Maioricimonas sp. JC845 TaxID=3232138 RepID=UPI00345A68E8
MRDTLQAATLYVGDLLWGWTLALPRDLGILLIAGLSTLLVLLLRRLLTDQPLLHDIRTDERMLRRLIRAAKRDGDDAALNRYRNTHTAVAAAKLSQEFRVLPVTVALILVTVTWGNERLPWLPLHREEPVRLELIASRIHAGRIVHLVPAPVLSTEGGWLQRLDEQAEPQPHAATSWTIRVDGLPDDGLLKIRFGDRTLNHPVTLNGPVDSGDRIRQHGYSLTTTLHLRPYRPFGLTIPWPVPYGIGCLVFYLAGRRLLRIE